jgi:formiminotetrahydrofolate cyclodeaminase
MTLLDRSLRDFLASLAAKTPTPGGGAVAALCGAIGAGLVSMAARFTSGKKHASVEEEALRVADACDRLRETLSRLADADCEAYDSVTAAYALPKETEAEKASRARAVESALERAIAVPRETMKASLEGLAIADAFASKANRNLASDVLVGGCCLHAAVEGARANVAINAASFSEPSKGKAHLEAADADLRMAGERIASIRKALASP